MVTSRDRPKSAPYPGLENSKKRPNVKYSILQYSKKWTDWLAKRGTLSKLSTILSQLKGDPSEKKQIFEKKISQCRKPEGGTLWDFKHPICCKMSKKLKGRPFGEKKNLGKNSHNAEKLKRDPLGIFNIQSVAKHQKIEEKKKQFRNKSSQCQKMKRGTLWYRPVWYVTQKNRKNLFGSIR